MTAAQGTKHFIDQPTHELEQLLLRTARTDVAPAEARERALRAAVSAAAAVGVVGGAGALGTRASLFKGTGWLVIKWLSFGAVSGLLGIGIVQGIQGLTAPPKQTARALSANVATPAPLPPQVVPIVAAAIPAPVPDSEPNPKQASKELPSAPPALVSSATAIADEPKGTSRVSSEPKSVLAFPPANTKSSLTHELTLLEETRSALREHAVSRALQLLDQYRAEFPHGSMAAQARALRVDALSEVSTAAEKKP